MFAFCIVTFKISFLVSAKTVFERVGSEALKQLTTT